MCARNRLIGNSISGDTDSTVPNPDLGQHILLDTEVISRIIEDLPVGATYIEIGAGPGTLTSRLAPRAERIIAYELDARYQQELDALRQIGDVDVRIGDFLDAPDEELDSLGEYHIIGNIPYHISEPLLTKLSRLHFQSATLLLGRRMAEILTVEHPGQYWWSRMSMLSRAYFNVKTLEAVPRTSFEPVPRADGAVLRLTRRDASSRWQSDAVTQSFRAMLEADEESSSVAKALRMVMVDAQGKAEAPREGISHVKDNRVRRRAGRAALKGYAREYNFGDREELSRIRESLVPENMLSIVAPVVDERILSKPVSGISNNDLKKLCSAITSAVNRRQKRARD